MNSLLLETMEYFWIKGVQNMIDLGWPLVSSFWILTRNLYDWRYKNMWNNTKEYLNTLSFGNLIN